MHIIMDWNLICNYAQHPCISACSCSCPPLSLISAILQGNCLRT